MISVARLGPISCPKARVGRFGGKSGPIWQPWRWKRPVIIPCSHAEPHACVFWSPRRFRLQTWLVEHRASQNDPGIRKQSPEEQTLVRTERRRGTLKKRIKRHTRHSRLQTVTQRKNRKNTTEEHNGKTGRARARGVLR